MSILIGVMMLAIHALVAVVLARQLGVVVGLMVYSLVVVGMVGIAGLLLRTAPLGVISWKNRVAGLMLSWSVFVGCGSLTMLMVKNAVAGVVLGGFAIACDRLDVGAWVGSSSGEGRSGLSHVIAWLAVLCWVVLGVGWVLLLRAKLVNRREAISTLILHRGSLIPLGVPPLAIGISIACWSTGQPLAALAVAGVPLLVVVSPVLLMMSVVLFYKLIGKPVRWN